MLSLVLPLLIIAIVLTPVIASARAVYKQEAEEQSSPLETIDLVNAEARH